MVSGRGLPSGILGRRRPAQSLLHGRDPATGLDCVGVLAAALIATGRPAPLPVGYALRTRDTARLAAAAAACGLAPMTGQLLPGDVAAFTVGPHQFHLGIAARQGGFVHAHAGLRKVVIGTVPAVWPIVGQWRLASDM